MADRLELHKVLVDILGSDQVYFQPPASVYLKYPVIIYSRKRIENTFADDAVYKQAHRYEITFIDKDPDSCIVGKISRLPRCEHDRHFTSENLNHDVFELYY